MGLRLRYVAAWLVAAALAAPGAQIIAATADGPPVAATTTTAPSAKMRVYKSDLSSVPALSGVPVGRVDALLEGAHLTRGATRYEARSGVAAGSVIGQSPAAGTAVKLGSPVDIVVSVAPPAAERTKPSAAPSPAPAPEAAPGSSGIDPRAALLGEVFKQLIKPRLGGSPPPAASAPGSDRVVPSPTPTPNRPTPTPAPAPERSVAVPDLVGKTLASQVALLRERQLGVESVTDRDSAQPVGVVLTQRPPPGTQVRPGTLLAVETSRGPPPRVVVPDVVGVDEEIAHQRLAARKLPFEARDSASTQSDGIVLAQSPAAGAAVAPGTTVRLRVSDGSLVVVPALVGETAESAARLLAEAGLSGDVQTRESRSPAGQVLEQQPGAGSTAPRGSTVQFWTAAVRHIAVPDLAGLTLDEAVARLGADLHAASSELDSLSVPAKVIAGQKPAPGTLVEVGSTVRVEVSLGPPQLADLQGKTPDEASAVVARSGARLGPPEHEFNAAPSGQVIGQSPPAGTRLARGSTVTIVVSRGPLWPWLAAGAAALALVLAGAAAALWPPVRYRIRFEPDSTGAHLAMPAQADGPALAVSARLERGTAILATTESGGPA